MSRAGLFSVIPLGVQLHQDAVDLLRMDGWEQEGNVQLFSAVLTLEQCFGTAACCCLHCRCQAERGKGC